MFPQRRDNYRWTINVLCTGRTENRQMLERLKNLGYSYERGGEIDPQKIKYNSHRVDDDGRKHMESHYGVHPSTRKVAFSDAMKMVEHRVNGNRKVYTLQEFLDYTQDEFRAELIQDLMKESREDSICR